MGTSSQGKLQSRLAATDTQHSYTLTHKCPPPISTHLTCHPPAPTQWSPKNQQRRERELRYRHWNLGVTRQAGAHLPMVPAACPQPCLRTNPGSRSGVVGRWSTHPATSRDQGSAERTHHLPHHILTQTWTGREGSPTLIVPGGPRALHLERRAWARKVSLLTGCSLPPDPATHPPPPPAASSSPAPRELSAHAPAGGTHKTQTHLPSAKTNDN